MPDTPLTSFLLDPNRQAYSSSEWANITGTMSSGSGLYTWNATTSVHYTDVLFGDFTMKMTVPAVPTAGDARQWGLKGIGFGDYTVFDVTGDVFTAKVSVGGVETSSTLAFSSAWATVVTMFRIHWEPGMVRFFINDSNVATISTGIPNRPMAFYVSNGNADALTSSGLAARDVKQASRVK